MSRATLTYHALLLRTRAIRPGDQDGARAFLDQLAGVLARGGLTDSERHYLYRLRRIWRARAAGTDARWMAVGMRPGRVGNQTRARLLRQIKGKMERACEDLDRARAEAVVEEAASRSHRSIDHRPVDPVASLLEKYS